METRVRCTITPLTLNHVNLNMKIVTISHTCSCQRMSYNYMYIKATQHAFTHISRHTTTSFLAKVVIYTLFGSELKTKIMELLVALQ